jgi:alpha-amylase
MPSICFYFQVHQPYRLRKYTFFDIGRNHNYENTHKNTRIIQKAARKCHLPLNDLIFQLIKRFNGKFKVAYSISGITLDQFQEYAPEVLDSFKRLADTGCVEFLNETYYHSLSFLFSKSEFKEQVTIHKDRIKELFGQTSKVFINTGLIYNNELAACIEEMGYQAILAEGTDHILGSKSPNFVYQPATCHKIKLFLNNYPLSDDIACQFSNSRQDGYTSLADSFENWIHEIKTDSETVNLFIHYRTFGTHLRRDTDIFNFMEVLVEKILSHPDCNFITPAEEAEMRNPVALIDVPHFISREAPERDLTAWMGNDMQCDALEAVYSLTDGVKRTNSPELLNTWRRLQMADHFYYMFTKKSNTGSTKTCSNLYNDPYESYINYMNILVDFTRRLKKP